MKLAWRVGIFHTHVLFHAIMDLIMGKSRIVYSLLTAFMRLFTLGACARAVIGYVCYSTGWSVSLWLCVQCLLIVNLIS